MRRQAARLATLARLARPVQHEINNLLTVIFANLEMLKRTAAEGAPQRQLDRIQAAAKRFEASTRSLLDLARRPVAGATEVKLAKALASLQPLLTVLLPAPGALTVEVPADVWSVRLDHIALDEALIALVREAAEVLPRGGSLSLAVANRPGAGSGPDLVELALGWPAGLDLPALAGLRAMAAAAGGVATEEAAALRLALPRMEATAT
ncbi:histidine kinase dimerization/phospho-acceptor domain-containing protein [Siccirubricoccus sp. G192]|uniref:histidine kinase dimerization/phospho-acceptor domain-containing protein n=1 Tax=Siccirubricoccus sp. G192 TaxID=2849651 RepID=UPI001C2C6461|nr:histidine kinase dimerization/phospho-acceptor domain-containing protein [Siccirubricoccus sp. G192]MBV1796995.1 hypothetical protein [Siccirubricoccus sp. G192]